MTITSWKIILKMLIGHQCISHIPVRTHYEFFFDRHGPFATKRTKTNIFSWLTVDLKNEMDYRDVLQQKFPSWKQAKTTRKTNRNKVNNLIKRATQNYNKNLLDQNTKNATSFWRTLKSIFPTKPKSKLTSTTFKVNKDEITNKKTPPKDLVSFCPV